MPLTVIDNGTPGYSETGQWFNSTPGMGGSHRYAPAVRPVNANTATWAFSGLTPGASYDVYATWTDFPNHSTRQRYALSHATGVAQVYVDQIRPPVGPTISGRPFQKLFTVAADSSGRVTVTTTSEAENGGYVTADACAVAEAGSIPTPPPPPVSQFSVAVRFVDNSITPSQQSIFRQAADRWGQVIVGDLPDSQFNGWFIYPAATVDDVLVDPTAVPIDGPGGVLGNAGPDSPRPDGHAVHGSIRFDSADVAALESQGGLIYTAMHEIGHILGIGSGSRWAALVSGTNFIGANAVREYKAIVGGNPTGVPLEQGGGAGTAGSHWAESAFGSELMTGYLNPGVNPLSRVTVGAMQDMGYVVDYSASDPYPSLVGAVVPVGVSVYTGKRRRFH